MTGPRHIARADVEKNPPARAHTHGLPWVSRAAWVAFAQVPSSDAISAFLVKLVLWDLVYIDGSRTTYPAIARRCNVSTRTAYRAVEVLQDHGLVTSVEQEPGRFSYFVDFAAVARLDRV